MNFSLTLRCLLTGILFGCLVGCTPDGAPSTDSPSEAHDHDHDHDHGDADHEGETDRHAEHRAPHGGTLIDLGRDHQFHAELKTSENAPPTLYLLDRDLNPLAEPPAKLTLVLIRGDDSRMGDLELSDPAEAAQYLVNDSTLQEWLTLEGTSGKIRVELGGTPVSGSW